MAGGFLGSYARQAGKLVDAELGLSTSAKDGARLENFKVQDSRYGVTIPVLYGCVRVAGNVIWASDLIETAHETSVSGGKGGVISSGLSASRTTYAYSLHCAVAIGFGPIGGVQRIWADSKVIYENGVWASGVVGSAAFHLGEEDQTVDPFLGSAFGQRDVASLSRRCLCRAGISSDFEVRQPPAQLDVRAFARNKYGKPDTDGQRESNCVACGCCEQAGRDAANRGRGWGCILPQALCHWLSDQRQHGAIRDR